MHSRMDHAGHDAAAGASPRPEGAERLAYVTLSLAGQLCGLPVMAVRDVLAGQTISRIPLAPDAVAGNINLRGRIVTAIDLRRRIGLPPRPPAARPVSVVTEHGAELYALIVDEVFEVVSAREADIETNPPTLSAAWSAHSRGIHRVAGQLMAVLDVESLLQLDPEVGS